MSDFPDGVCGTIRMAVELNLRRYHQQQGEENLPWCDLPVDVVKAVKWVHSVNPDVAVSLAWQALTTASVDDGPPLEAAARCLRHSLTQSSHPYGEWTPEMAEGFVTAALILS